MVINYMIILPDLGACVAGCTTAGGGGVNPAAAGPPWNIPPPPPNLNMTSFKTRLGFLSSILAQDFTNNVKRIF